jgi:hypothetical protein
MWQPQLFGTQLMLMSWKVGTRTTDIEMGLQNNQVCPQRDAGQAHGENNHTTLDRCCKAEQSQGVTDSLSVVLEYQFDRHLACVWLVGATFLSIAATVLSWLLDRDANAAFGTGSALLGLLTTIHKILIYLIE